jgi:hypothetical protein
MHNHIFVLPAASADVTVTTGTSFDGHKPDVVRTKKGHDDIQTGDISPTALRECKHLSHLGSLIDQDEVCVRFLLACVGCAWPE